MTRSPRELANQKNQLRKQQEKLLSDMLTVIDSLDRAVEHWQQAEHSTQKSQKSQNQPPSVEPTPWWQRWRQWFTPSSDALSADSPPSDTDSLAEVVTSAKEGIEMIRDTMLDVLSQHQVVPLPAKGQPFNPERMHALGQQADAIAPPNTVVQEVVRGYQWKDRMLREAQVIVAASGSANTANAANFATEEEEERDA